MVYGDEDNIPSVLEFQVESKLIQNLRHVGIWLMLNLEKEAGTPSLSSWLSWYLFWHTTWLGSIFMHMGIFCRKEIAHWCLKTPNAAPSVFCLRQGNKFWVSMEVYQEYSGNTLLMNTGMPTFTSLPLATTYVWAKEILRI